MKVINGVLIGDVAARKSKSQKKASKKTSPKLAMVSSVFKKMVSADTKVSKLKAQHKDAQAKLEIERNEERDRQRTKLGKV